MTEEQKAICHKIADYYGTEHQAVKAIEEMAELQKELAKFTIGDGGDIDSIVEELADVMIMIEQMRYCFDTDGVWIRETIRAKLGRQINRMKASEEGGCEDVDKTDR